MSSWAEVYIELYPTSAGGRQTPVDLCNDHPGSYRPHLRPLANLNELRGVEFMDGPDDPVAPGSSTYATVHFLNELVFSDDPLVEGAEFEIVEDQQAVGRGRITRRN